MNQIAKHDDARMMEIVLAEGDLSRLTPEQRVRYYLHTCHSQDLNPYTRPFEYIRLNGKLVLYARRDAADQLRSKRGISLAIADQRIDGDLFIVHVKATDKNGRIDEDMGVVQIGNLKGEARANAILKAVTKAKRRATLSICGLGFVDESEIGDIPDARPEPHAMPSFGGEASGSMREHAAQIAGQIGHTTTADYLGDNIPTLDGEPAQKPESDREKLRSRADAAIQSFSSATDIKQVQKFEPRTAALLAELDAAGMGDVKQLVVDTIVAKTARLNAAPSDADALDLGDAGERVGA